MPSEVTIAIAVYGAVLATLGFVLSVILGINELNKNNPRIRISLGNSQLIDPNYNPSEPLIGVNVVNRGISPVIISSCGWLRKDKSKEVLLNLYRVKFPYKLEPGRRLDLFMAVRWYKEKGEMDLRSAFFIEDETGLVWYKRISKKIRQQWNRMDPKGWKILWSEKSNMYLEEYNVPPNMRGDFR